MILHRDGVPRRDDGGTVPASVPEIGRFLRRERTRQGLDLNEVSARTGIGTQQLNGLEGGTVDRMPDRVQTLKALRRYADFLGLPGDTYVLVLVDHWPTGSLAAPVVSVHAGVPARPDDTGVVPAVSPGGPGAWAGGSALPVAASTVTGSLLDPFSGTATTHAVGAEPLTAQVPRVIDTTGPLPVVPGWSPERSSRTTLALRLVIGFLTLALVVGVAGIVVNWTKPQWLQDLGITHAATPTHGGTGKSTTTTSAAPTVAQVATGAGTATFSVHAPSFEIVVLPVGSPSWVQVTEPSHSAPIFSATIPAGGKQQFSVQGDVVVQVGASSAHIAVVVGNKLVGGFAPPSAPFTVTYRST